MFQHTPRETNAVEKRRQRARNWFDVKVGEIPPISKVDPVKVIRRKHNQPLGNDKFCRSEWNRLHRFNLADHVAEY